MPEKYKTTNTRSQGRTNLLHVEGSRAKESSSTFDDAAKKAEAAEKQKAKEDWISKNYSGLGGRSKYSREKEAADARFESEYAKAQGQKKAVSSMKDETPKP